MKHSLLILTAALAVFLLTFAAIWEYSLAQPYFDPPCESPGWFTDIALKDHAVFYFDGYYYLASIYDPSNNKFAYARSADLCTWEELAPILSTGPKGSPDEGAIWAPHVIEENGVFYMYYTGVTNNITQSIMLATTTNPADPASWEKIPENDGLIFTPAHDGMVWEESVWADCRDPMVFKISGKYADTFVLYYSGLDVDGGIIGYATSSSPSGPWADQGRVAPPLSKENPIMVPESPVLVARQNYYYLFYNDTVLREERYQVSTTPFNFSGDSKVFRPGWAHEIWQAVDGSWFASYLPFRPERDVEIQQITWSKSQPPIPFITDSITYLYLPVINH